MKQYTYAEIDASPEDSVFFGGSNSVFVKSGFIVWWAPGRGSGKRKAWPVDNSWRRNDRAFTKAEGFEIRDTQMTCVEGKPALDFVLVGTSPQVVLNNEHTAEVTPDGIKVGCQTFPLSIVDDLVRAVKQVKGLT